MEFSLCIVQLLCLIGTLSYGEYSHKWYTKTGGSKIGTLDEITLLNRPRYPSCAIICLHTTGCDSFTYIDSTGICQLKENGYGEWNIRTGEAKLLDS